VAIFHANEYVLNLPDGLRDKSVQIFSLTDEGPSEFSVVVTRERPGPGETVERFVERGVASLLSRLPLFRVLEREVVRIDDQPAIVTEYAWQSPEGKACQRQAVVYTKGPNLMIVVTATYRGDSMPAKWKAMFGELLAGFRLRPS
jgi:hypothetical protein